MSTDTNADANTGADKYFHVFAYDPIADTLRGVRDQLLADVARIAELVAALHGVALCDPNPLEEAPPIIAAEGIAFAAMGNTLADEALVIDLEPPAGFGCWFEHPEFAKRGFLVGSCATARVDYDTAVTAVLLRAHRLAPDAFVIASMGSWNGRWHPARNLLRELPELADAPFDRANDALAPFAYAPARIGPPSAHGRGCPTCDLPLVEHLQPCIPVNGVIT